MSDHRGFSKAALTLHRLPVSRTSRPFKNLVAEMEKDKRSPQPKHDAQSADVSGKSEEREHSSSNDMRDDELKDLLARLDEMQTSLLAPQGDTSKATGENLLWSDSLLFWMAAAVVAVAIFVAGAAQISNAVSTLQEPRQMSVQEPSSMPPKPSQCRPVQALGCPPATSIGSGAGLDFFLFGEPIAKSPSPALHTAGFTSCGLLHTYALHPATDATSVSKILGDDAFGGASVTIPLKEVVVKLADNVSAPATAIGAVNTLMRCADGSIYGTNTDWLGIHLLVSNMQLKRSLELPILGTAAGRALVIGAGGTARAAVYALNELGLDVWVWNRTPARAAALVAHLGAGHVLLPGGDSLETALAAAANDGKSDSGAFEVIVSTIPASATLSIPGKTLVGGHCASGTASQKNSKCQTIIMDAAYVVGSSDTELISQAKMCGCRTIAGLELLQQQGILQFEMWTGVRAPLRAIEAAVLEHDASF